MRWRIHAIRRDHLGSLSFGTAFLNTIRIYIRQRSHLNPLCLTTYNYGTNACLAPHEHSFCNPRLIHVQTCHRVYLTQTTLLPTGLDLRSSSENRPGIVHVMIIAGWVVNEAHPAATWSISVPENGRGRASIHLLGVLFTLSIVFCVRICYRCTEQGFIDLMS